MMPRNIYRIARYALLFAGASSLATAAFAQTEAAPSESSGDQLGEIVVTAQKRTESLQSTPLAVSAVTKAVLEQRGITDVQGLNAIAPNLAVTQSPSSSNSIVLSIRGIGDSATVMTNDPPIGLYVDGIVIGRPIGAIFDLVDLERVEVLRGPQGTLYGRNTTGGTVNLITAKPKKRFALNQTFSIGNFDYKQSRTVIDTGEIGDSGLTAKFAYLHKSRDGYVDNVLAPSRHDPGADNTDAFRIAVGFDRGPVRIDYAFDYTDQKSSVPAFQLAAVSPAIAKYIGLSPELGGSSPQISRDRLGQLRLDKDRPVKDRVRGHTLTAEVDLADHLTLRSLTGYRTYHNIQPGTDLDGNGGLVGFTVSPAVLAPPYSFIPLGVQPISLFHASNERRQHQWSQEFNLLGNIGDKFEFVLGAFYFKEKSREDNPQNLLLVRPSSSPIPITPDVTGDQFGVSISTRLAYAHASTSRALFGQGTFHVTDKLSLMGGLRYTEDKKHLTQTAPMVRELSTKFDKLNWSATVQYDWTDDIMTYAHAASGYKAGGFNARSVNAGYGPENLTSYEIGLKSELFDRRVRFNASIFHAENKDLQVQQILAGTNGASSITVNAGKARFDGVEAELTALLTRGLTINGSVGYVDRKYKKFVILNPITDTDIDVHDQARFPWTSSTTLNVGAQYDFPKFDFGQLTARLDYSYRGKTYWHPLGTIVTKAGDVDFAPFNDKIAQPGYGLLDGRIELSKIAISGAEMSVSVWGRNLTNKKYAVSGIDFGSLGFAGVIFGMPRAYGLDVRIGF